MVPLSFTIPSLLYAYVRLADFLAPSNTSAFRDASSARARELMH